ncbi:MAG: McrC family protein [Cryomorphaceae bacterium]|nr:McrC family protein [Cryomorphaceae bacterium]
MIQSINRYEHDSLFIGQEGFEKIHWNAMVKLNALHDGAYFDILPSGVKFKQFVGVLQIENLLLHIHPKADKDDADAKWHGVLLQMLQSCGKLRAQTNDDAMVKRQDFNLLEVYFEDYLRQVENLLHTGLIKQYRKTSGNLKVLKGKLAFSENIRHNLVHKERFYTTHEVYDNDHFLHQVMTLALQILGLFTRGSRLNDRWRRVQLAFPEVMRIKPSAKQLDGFVFSRKTEPYRRAFELARLIILNYSPDINRGAQNMISLLFDMNKLWEEFVFVMLRKELESPHTPYKHYRVQAQVSKRFWHHNSLQPDMLVTHEPSGRHLIIDTKWKRHSTSIDDLRQVYAYGRFWKAEKVMLLYPGSHQQNQQHPFQTTDHINGQIINHQGYLRFIDVVENGRLNTAIGKQILEGVI